MCCLRLRAWWFARQKAGLKRPVVAGEPRGASRETQDGRRPTPTAYGSMVGPDSARDLGALQRVAITACVVAATIGHASNAFNPEVLIVVSDVPAQDGG